MLFKIDWASLIVENLPFFLCFPLYLRAISKYKPPGAYIWRGDFTEGFFAIRVWGAYIWRGLYMEQLILGILRYFFAQNMCITINKQLRRALVCLLFVLLPLLATEQTQWQERDRRDAHFFLTCHIYCLILLLQHQKCPI